MGLSEMLSTSSQSAAKSGHYTSSSLHPYGAGPKWGLNLLDSKEAYTVSGQKTYVNWPEEYARNLATSESDHAFHQILQQLPKIDLAGIHGLEERIDRIEKEITQRDIGATVAFVSRQNPLLTVDRSLRNLTPFWLVSSRRKENPEFIGQMNLRGKTVPVFSVWANRDANLGCVMQLSECILWEQQPPADNVDEATNVLEEFYFQLVDFSTDANARRQLLAEDPEWLKQHTDQERYLSLRVTLRVLERFELKVLDSTTLRKWGFWAGLDSWA